MKNRVLLLVALISACTMSCSSSSSPGYTQADLQAIMETELQAYSRDKINYSGGIAMQILTPWSDYFISSGMGNGMDNSHRFRTASVTKTFTAASIMLLHERGQLNINHKLSDNIPGTAISYFPYAIPHRNEITIKMILMHRAGIFDLTNTAIQDNAASHGKSYVGKCYIDVTMSPPNEEHQFTYDELFSILANDEQVGFEPPDSKYDYSDTGYTILAYIIERVAGKSYEAFVRDEFLMPNGLSNTSLPWQGTDRTLPPPFVHGYSWDGSAINDVTECNMSGFVGNGNMITTPLDLATWAKRLLTGQTALTMSTIEVMKTGLPTDRPPCTYGLGILYYPNFGYGHEGDHQGYSTFMYYKPEQDVAFVAFMNTWDISGWPNSYIAQKRFLANTVLKVFARMGM